MVYPCHPPQQINGDELIKLLERSGVSGSQSCGRVRMLADETLGMRHL